MLEHRKDPIATKAARQAKQLVEYKSFISFAGHVYLTGKDRSRRRDEVFSAQKACQICGKALFGNRGEMNHKEHGRPVARCDCFFTPLADGTICTNLERVCGRFDDPPCHTVADNHDLRWTKRKP